MVIIVLQETEQVPQSALNNAEMDLRLIQKIVMMSLMMAWDVNLIVLV